MPLVKCPRCELNFISDKERICKICYRELYGKMPPEDEVELCSTCSESPVVPGRDVCMYCLREMNKQKGIKDEPEETVEIELDPVSGMEEIIPDISEDDDPAFREMGDALSLEEMGEQEDENDEETDE